MAYPPSWGIIKICSWIIISTFGQPIIYAFMLVGLPTVVLYCTQCLVILRQRQFHNAFYVLFFVRFFLDCLLLIGNYVNYRLPSIAGPSIYSFYQQLPNWFFVGMYVTNPYAVMGSSLATTFMLLNRLSAILIPFKHKKLWKKMLPAVLIIIFVVPCVFFRYFFGMKCRLKLNDDKSAFLVEEETSYAYDDAPVLFFAAIFFLVLCLAINLAILVAYKWRHGGASNVSNVPQIDSNQIDEETRRIERMLIVYAMITFISHVLYTLLTIGFYVANMFNEWLIVGAMLNLTPLVYDVGAIMMPAWLLLWASPEFRQKWCQQWLTSISSKWFQQQRRRLWIAFINSKNTTIQVMPSRQQNSSPPAALWAQRIGS